MSCGRAPSRVAEFQRGLDAARKLGCLDGLTSGEILTCGGPDFLAGEATDKGPDFHRGWDAAILRARAT